ncbi:MAG: hypothetical protein VX346_05420 [Planctomycetota bacterium]|nr:hypothetical protein [Planctomycetota bacterium]
MTHWVSPTGQQMDKQPTDATLPEVVAGGNQIELDPSELLLLPSQQIRPRLAIRAAAEVIAMASQRRMSLVALRLQKMVRTLRLLKRTNRR